MQGTGKEIEMAKISVNDGGFMFRVTKGEYGHPGYTVSEAEARFEDPVAVFAEIHTAIQNLGRSGELVEVIAVHPYQHGYAFPKSEKNTAYGKIVIRPPENIVRGCNQGKQPPALEVGFESDLNPGSLAATVEQKVTAELLGYRVHLYRSLSILDSHLT